MSTPLPERPLQAYQVTIWAAQRGAALSSAQLTAALCAGTAQMVTAQPTDRPLSLNAARRGQGAENGLSLPEGRFIQARAAQARPGTLVVRDGRLYLDLGSSLSRLTLCAFQALTASSSAPAPARSDAGAGAGTLQLVTRHDPDPSSAQALSLPQAALAFAQGCSGRWNMPPIYAAPLAGLDEGNPLGALLHFEYPEADGWLQFKETLLPVFQVAAVHVSPDHTELLLDQENPA